MSSSPSPYAVLRVHSIPLSLSGGYDREATPVPIPNTAVKLSRADDTWLVTARENRSPPDFIKAAGQRPVAFFFCREHPTDRCTDKPDDIMSIIMAIE